MSHPPPSALADHQDIFVGDGEMARLMRSHDWAATPLGTPDTWPNTLKVAIRLLLTSRFEMWMGWGPDIAFFYNDAYRPTLGDKHPRSLAMPTRELWKEIWHDVQPRLQVVYERGEATWDRALLLLLQRHGYAEETYHTFSYSPLLGDTGQVKGVFCAVTEETERVQNALAGVARGSKLASQLLAFGRRQPLEPKVVNIGRFIKNMDDMLRRALGEEVEVETVISGGLWNTLVDPGQIENALLNLAINARDAMDGRGRLTIEAGNALLDDGYARLHDDLQPGQYVMVAVADTGTGIAPLRTLAAAPMDVLLTDVGLPDLTGDELARQALQRWPALRIVFATGDHEAPAKAGVAKAVVLSKPYEPEDLSAALDKVRRA